ncbi:ATP-binding domain-containing protein [Marinobacter daepoensis]|uniref:DNA 3'-5' helicase II n=1 Tax=Marinobacter daepoensis TaxID=262077 RepID=A0ABS3BE98_9GAMM|nr:ATP-binding domain-containing protein [Marinobacter daepoensis]MBN7769032.1 DEAD/DEAH box helicase [Marinobacter daepoensis]MBY6077722.1 ATP-binding domain-containing protein [Marinobacter daepoensis]
MQYLPGSLELDNSPYDVEVWRTLTQILGSDREGYCAYQIPMLGSVDTSEVPTFIVVTPEIGILLIDIVSNEINGVEEDGRVWGTPNGYEPSRDVLLELYGDEIETRLKRNSEFYDRRSKSIKVNLERILLFRENHSESLREIGVAEYCISKVVGSDEIDAFLTSRLQQGGWDSSVAQFNEVLSLLEGTEAIGRTSGYVKKEQIETINDYLQASLARTFKQDRAQRQISMQIPSGPQRIRGLAGTGKTVVLSLKAALTAIRAKDFKILYLFNTQSLYNMIERLISDYYARESKSAIDWENLDVLHAWGGRAKRGLYSHLCSIYGLAPLTFNDVRGARDGLARIYSHLLEMVGDNLEPMYDLVLIDEAQDFPNEVFQVVHRITKDPKRIVWAYDDFQSLKELRIREPEEMFGKKPDGTPVLPSSDLSGSYEGGVEKDFVLPNCYRNPRILLMVAHGVALGIYSKAGIVDSVDNVSDWNALGYRVLKPEAKAVIEANDIVEVERPDENSTNLLEALLTENQKSTRNLVKIYTAESKSEEQELIANKIYELITEQKVAPEEIFVITLNTRQAEQRLKPIRSLLNSSGIDSIIPGIVEKPDQFKEKGKVTLTTPFKAKGNEANVVFVMDSESVTPDPTFRKRNAFFVSVTRSRGWCYITGLNCDGMQEIVGEIQAIIQDIPVFKYTRPEDDVIRRRRMILSKPDDETEKMAKLLKELEKNHPDLLREHLERMNKNN